MLTHKLRIFVPTKDKEGNDLPEAQIEHRINNTLYTFSTRFGRATTYSAEGAYVTDYGLMIKEKIQIVEVFSDDETLYTAGEIHAGLIATVDNQETVLYEFDGKAYFAENWKTVRAREGRG